MNRLIVIVSDRAPRGSMGVGGQGRISAALGACDLSIHPWQKSGSMFGIALEVYYEICSLNRILTRWESGEALHGSPFMDLPQPFSTSGSSGHPLRTPRLQPGTFSSCCHA